MQKPAVDIYSGPLLALTASLLADMSKMSHKKTGMKMKKKHHRM